MKWYGAQCVNSTADPNRIHVIFFFKFELMLYGPMNFNDVNKTTTVITCIHTQVVQKNVFLKKTNFLTLEIDPVS